MDHSGEGARDCPHLPADQQEDTQRGHTICGACGQVVGDNILRTERVNWEEGHPAKMHQKSFSRFQPRQRVYETGYDHSISEENRRSSILIARRELQSMCHQYQTSPEVQQVAMRLYGMMLSRGIHNQVKRSTTLSVCLYIACRLQNTNHVMYQFVEGSGVELGKFNRIYCRLCGLLDLNIPPTDPSLYLERLAQHLDLEDSQRIHVIEKAHSVLLTMRKEWIDYGRRPQGIVATALLIACRSSGYTCSIERLGKLILMSENTLLERLREFAKTPTAIANGKDASNQENAFSLPPKLKNLDQVRHLREKIESGEKRLQRLRADLRETLIGRASMKSPLTNVLWDNYWDLREEVTHSFDKLVRMTRVQSDTLTKSFQEEIPAVLRTGLEDAETNSSITEVDRRATSVVYQLPCYQPLKKPELNEEGLLVLKNEVNVFASVDAHGTEVSLTEEDVQYASEKLKNSEEISQSECISSQEARENSTSATEVLLMMPDEAEIGNESDVEIDWDLVSLPDSECDETVYTSDHDVSTFTDATTCSTVSKAQVYPEIEYDENIYMRKKNIHEQEYEMFYQRRTEREARRGICATLFTSTGSEGSVGSQSLQRSSSRRRKTIPVPTASTPSEATLNVLSRGVSSGINPVSLRALLEEPEDDLDLPQWSTMVGK